MELAIEAGYHVCSGRNVQKNLEKNVDTPLAFCDIGGAHRNNKNSKHMRTKTLLAMAAMSVAAATSWAQVYSVNAVGYVNVTIPADGAKLALLANPLNGTNNQLNTIL